jgi:DNA-binding NarL/FixJ family response regulator
LQNSREIRYKGKSRGGRVIIELQSPYDINISLDPIQSQTFRLQQPIAQLNPLTMVYHRKNFLKIVVIDDHPLVLEGTLAVIASYFEKAKVHTAHCALEGFALIQDVQPNLTLLDLAIPHIPGGSPQTEHGLHLLKCLMENDPDLNLTIQSCLIHALIRLIHDIDVHQGGFTIADKACSIPTLLQRMEWALQGINYTQDIQTTVEIRPEWLELLKLAFEQGLQDKAIAVKMNKSERMVCQYWSKVRDVLGVYPEASKNLRFATYIEAKKMGMID